MPSSEEIRALIEKLQKQGLSPDEIAETLSDMGVDPSAFLSSQQQSASTVQPSGEQPVTPQSAPQDDDLFAPLEPPVPTTPSPSPKQASASSGDDDLFSLKAQIVGAPSDQEPPEPPSEQNISSAQTPTSAPAPPAEPVAQGGVDEKGQSVEPPIPTAPQVEDVLSTMLGGTSTAPAESQPTTGNNAAPSPATPETPNTPVQSMPSASPAAPAEEFHATVTAPPLVEDEDRRLSEIHEKVHEIHSAVASGSLAEEIAEINDLLHEVASDVKELKAMYSAIQRILQQILETDRSLLVILYVDVRKKR